MSELGIERMRQALKALVKRSSQASDPYPEEDPREAMAASLAGERYVPFVIFTERASGKFVQFAGDKSRPLILDLPLQALSAAERERAAALFAELGVDYPEVGKTYDLVGNPAGSQSTYRLEFDRDVETALSVAIAVFKRIYKLEDELEIVLDEE